jgi:hypothetical protein
MIDLDSLDYSRLDYAETYLVELVTPSVLASGYPEANDRTISWWWAENRDYLRFREEKILEQREVFRLETVYHGQFVKYLDGRPVETAKNGPFRVSSHSRDGFAELPVHSLDIQYQTSGTNFESRNWVTRETGRVTRENSRRSLNNKIVFEQHLATTNNPDLY